MILGMSLATFTLVHVTLSLVGVGSGFIVAFGVFTGRRMNSWTALFLLTTIATSLTGFLFPVEHLMPSHILGILSLVVLGLAIAARYAFQLARGWSRTYVITAISALYFSVFVAVQAFEKMPALKAAAPTQKELPFVVTQFVVLLPFIVLGIAASKRFVGETLQAADRAA
jgi:hypothetical protein